MSAFSVYKHLVSLLLERVTFFVRAKNVTQKKHAPGARASHTRRAD